MRTVSYTTGITCWREIRNPRFPTRTPEPPRRRIPTGPDPGSYACGRPHPRLDGPPHSRSLQSNIISRQDAKAAKKTGTEGATGIGLGDGKAACMADGLSDRYQDLLRSGSASRAGVGFTR